MFPVQWLGLRSVDNTTQQIDSIACRSVLPAARLLADAFRQLRRLATHWLCSEQPRDVPAGKTGRVFFSSLAGQPRGGAGGWRFCSDVGAVCCDENKNRNNNCSCSDEVVLHSVRCRVTCRLSFPHEWKCAEVGSQSGRPRRGV